jgi:hypothetical protein
LKVFNHDAAAFLKKMRDAFLGATTTYRRELMNVDFDKKGVTW